MAPRLTIVMPVLSEAGRIAEALRALAPLRARGHEVIVVDGGSTDGTAELAAPLCDQLLRSPRGRALQMNAGARMAQGDALVFLHADTRLPDGADTLIGQALANSPWGRFDRIIDPGWTSRPSIGSCAGWESSPRPAVMNSTRLDSVRFEKPE